AGPRCRRVVAALHRLDAPPGAFPFYEEHATADPRHGKDWLDRGVSSLNRLKAGIEKVRRDGYCLSRGMVTRGVGVVGMVVPTPPNHRPLAIGVAGPVERIEKNLARILAAIRAENVRLAHFASTID
ncbi:MAG: hypothetical protein ACXWLK_11895, partial [Rhizomicrobium sp.]